jgi:hypothetical protein
LKNIILNDVSLYQETFQRLQASNEILTSINPILVFSHFSLHPHESANVIPARNRHIPTITTDHGISGFWAAEYDSFSAENVFIGGEVMRKAYKISQNYKDRQIHTTGNPRADLIKRKLTKTEARSSHGLPLNKKIVIFCDNSGWLQSAECQYGSYSTLKEAIALAKKIQNSFLIFRVHHGRDYKEIEKYVHSLKLDNFLFQVSPNPEFVNIAQAADVVISHKTSAIGESLLIGCPVVYLHEGADIIDWSYKSISTISFASTFSEAKEQAERFIALEMSPTQCLEQSSPYLNYALSFFGQPAASNYVEHIKKILANKHDILEIQEWFNRTKYASQFDSTKWSEHIKDYEAEAQRIQS